MTKIKNIDKPPRLYRVGRAILGPIFRWWYRPTIIGKENLPTKGNCIITSNHIHLYDQCHTLISVKRRITYMAKKEYFDNKKTAWFFRGVACIPVDRTKKDPNATGSALEVLKSGGAIGIFPEGTRNALKEERIQDIYNEYFKDLNYEEFSSKLKVTDPKLSQIKYLLNLYDEKKISKDDLLDMIYDPDKALKGLLKKKKITKHDYLDSRLLPFKFGAVSMASKTDSYLVPTCVTGEYKFKTKNLVVRYGKPFKVGDMDLEKANNKLREDTLKLMEESLKDELNNL